jgi:hypothetical protein
VMAASLSSPRLKVTGSGWRQRIVLIGLVILAAGVLLVWGWVQWKARRSLELAVAEADRLDPRWRLADLVASRRQVPAATNSANRVLAVAKGIPENWPDVYESAPKRSAAQSGDSDLSIGNFSTDAAEHQLAATEIEEAVRNTPPNAALKPVIYDGVVRLLKPVNEAIAAARLLAGATEGRYEFEFSEVAISPNRPHIEAVRRVSRLLYLDSTRQSQAGKIDDALTSARGIIGVARSIGDEPVELSQLFRLHQRRAALSAILRAIGQGDASDAVLAAVQDDLARELEHDLLLCAMRAQRAEYFDTLGKMTNGAYARYASGDFAPPDPPGEDRGRARPSPVSQALYMRAFGLYNQAIALAVLTQSVEGAKYPQFDPRWTVHWTAFEQGLESGGWIQRRLGATAYTILPLNSTMVWRSYESHALFGATRVLIGAERYRRAHGRWPEKIGEIVPAYLVDVPRGPYSDEPARFVRKKDRIIAYAVGLHGEDHGGRLHPKRERDRDYDVGEQLWNPEFRHSSEPES